MMETVDIVTFVVKSGTAGTTAFITRNGNLRFGSDSMGIFNEFNKKEKPFFTGIARGFGFGGGGGGAAAPGWKNFLNSKFGVLVEVVEQYLVVLVQPYNCSVSNSTRN